jgi:hypothetical protein
MNIEIYGKQDCGLCHSAQKKIGHMLSKWAMTDRVPVVFRDMGTVEGAAEGDFHDVFEIPSVLLKDGETVVARWDGKPPPSDQLRARLDA